MHSPWVQQRGDAVILSVHAQPGAPRTEAAGEHDGALRIRLAAPPINGKANEALLAFVARQLDLPRGNVLLVGGAGSRHKRVKVWGTSPEAAAKAFKGVADRRIRESC